MWPFAKKKKEQPEKPQIMIHLEGGPLNGRRLMVDQQIFTLTVPMATLVGVAQYHYHPTDRLTMDDVQIWR